MSKLQLKNEEIDNHVFLDEGAIFPQNNSLKTRLRDLEEVPNAQYVVENERVFVFEALVKRVQELISKSPPNKSLKEIALTALPKSWVSPSEAVGKWHDRSPSL
ncbi:MAG: hypothetical protein HC784_12320 [Hydrococcus sp. CSU_1_8]|nr:hypothetical protein [Hydrococcus sp. CSU_1_8]